MVLGNGLCLELSEGFLDQCWAQSHACSSLIGGLRKRRPRRRSSLHGASHLTGGPSGHFAPGSRLAARQRYCCCWGGCCCLESVSLTSAAVMETSMRSGFCANIVAGMTTAL